MTWDGVPSYQELADELFKLQSTENEGRGVSCVRSIVDCLRSNNGEDAHLICRNEFGKIRNYPKIVAWVLKNKIVEKADVYWKPDDPNN